MSGAQLKIVRLARFNLTTADAIRSAAFYEAAFGCRIMAMERIGGSRFETEMGVSGGASRITLSLGREIIELLQFDLPGAPYPAGASASDLVFQHFAIVVSDMAKAFRNLTAVSGWTPISRGGPQTLPQSSGGVTAFKFRDPEGHPLELLAFPNGWRGASRSGPADALCLGLDHSAISVSDSAKSVAFYETLGLRVSARSRNHGREQEKLDDLRGVQVDVTALQPPMPAPHLELLCYGAGETALPRRSNDIASTRLVFEMDQMQCSAPHSAKSQITSDPDGHDLRFVFAARDPDNP
jgi:catechol 2,3-dioxygenase-like lactoylglutathione lyase family enzyme